MTDTPLSHKKMSFASAAALISYKIGNAAYSTPTVNRDKLLDIDKKRQTKMPTNNKQRCSIITGHNMPTQVHNIHNIIFTIYSQL